MSTYIQFKRGGITAHIKDVCIGGATMHLFVETGKIYESEHIAIKRAIIYYRKKLKSDGLIRNRRQIHRRRRQLVVLEENYPEIVIPRIIKFRNECNELRYLVSDTGKEFKKEGMALRNAIRYAKARYNK